MTDAEKVLAAIRAELDRAMSKHTSPIRSPHEGYAVVLEELDEAWDEVRGNRPGAMAEELVQTAAMCVRTIIDLGLTGKVQL